MSNNDPKGPTVADAIETIYTVHAATALSISRIDKTIESLDKKVDSMRGDMNRRFDRLETLITTFKPKRKRPQDRE